MNIVGILSGWINHYRSREFFKRGLQTAGDCHLLSMPHWGSECLLISIRRHLTMDAPTNSVVGGVSTRAFKSAEASVESCFSSTWKDNRHAYQPDKAA